MSSNSTNRQPPLQLVVGDELSYVAVVAAAAADAVAAAVVAVDNEVEVVLAEVLVDNNAELDDDVEHCRNITMLLNLRLRLQSLLRLRETLRLHQQCTIRIP